MLSRLILGAALALGLSGCSAQEESDVGEVEAPTDTAVDMAADMTTDSDAVASIPAASDKPVSYREDTGWLKPGGGTATIGDSHGEIAVSRSGDIYISVEKTPPGSTLEGGLHVYSADGEYQRSVPNASNQLHGFILHTDPDGTEYIYGGDVWNPRVAKQTLDGEEVLVFDPANVPEEYKKLDDEGNHRITVTGIVVGPDQDIYIVDGYGLDFVHRFSSDGTYKSTFGGRDSPWFFENCHKIAIDPRFTPQRILCTDRVNGRLVHMDLDGDLIEVHAKDLRRPSAVAFHGDTIAVAEISGRVTLLDKEGEVIQTIGENTTQAEINTNETAPEQWRDGIFTSPHGIAFDDAGNLYVSEWNKWGRVLRFVQG